ncbi:MAG: Asp23/Gls24 family envelope stress response protein [Oscillospiraceae bacterium]|nr:Asp23/Gls24 family envelope stress response protein [Oscillospiraceae bacterium]
MKTSTDLGSLVIASDVFTSISGMAVNNCFGVKGMVSRSVSDGIAFSLRCGNLSKGVKVFFSPEGTVNIELHIAVEHGFNIPVVCKSIIAEVRYVVEKITGVPVSQVEIFVDSILSDQ